MNGEDKFHNPYHFVPVKSERRAEDEIPREGFPKSTGRAWHDKYGDDIYSGRIICCLTTETPIFIGAKRNGEPSDEAPVGVTPFKLDGKPAIPATSLRGLISGIVEAASNSALRVLEEKPYSFRRSMSDSLSAIGMVFVDQDGNGKERYWLRPLTLPTIKLQVNRPVSLPEGYSKLFPIPDRPPQLKVYIGNYTDKNRRLPYQTFSFANKKYYGLKLQKLAWTKDRKLVPEPRTSFLLDQKMQPPFHQPRPWDEIPQSERGQYTRGIIRVLGVEGRDDIPGNKKHEIFIPYPEEADKWQKFEIAPEAIKRFYDLADQRTEASDKDAESPWPYEPKGTKRNPDPKDKRFRLKDGDLVYFRPHPMGGAIAEISLSSIWRGRVETILNGKSERATAYTFFERINKELLPFQPKPKREKITLAELLFGFVEDKRGRQPTDDNPALALASRVWFSHAKLHRIENGDSPYLPEVTLKILDSPKPPSPALYFKMAAGANRHIAKSQLDPAKHDPQGRKFYLHHRDDDVKKECWKSELAKLGDKRFKQKVAITPIRSGAVFYFHLDSDNLSERELGLLLYALQPTENFRHKIGMGKPIGLGRVRIEPVGIYRVNRSARYSSAGLFAPRYSEAWVAENAKRDDWPSEYKMEKSSQCDTDSPNPMRHRDAFRDSMNKDIQNALELIGNPKSVTARVHTPLVIGGDDEDETFKWFVANDRGSKSGQAADRQCLEPLNSQTDKMPELYSVSRSK
ncbi:MAG: TIGR03986 family CRISPR-associated RAMP protein [Blastocatellales bacterium]